jgi:hypothetical protein
MQSYTEPGISQTFLTRLPPMARIRRYAAAALASLCALAATAQPIFIVLDYGEVPREEIRYRFTAGSAAQATLTLNFQVSLSAIGFQIPATTIAPIEVPFSIRTTEVRADGSARYDFELGQPRIPEDAGGNRVLAERLLSSFGQAGGTSAWYRLDARGDLLEAGPDSPTGAVGEAARMPGVFQGALQQLAAHFPAEAIGIGARWRITQTDILEGLPIEQSTEFTLKGRDGDAVELGIGRLDAATAPPVGVPGASPQDLAVLGTIDGQSDGLMQIDLGEIVPALRMSTAMSMGSPTQGQAPLLGMAMQMTMSVTPAEASQ